jgi:HPt (histidine-containing phosphotransfer) domain-containing protein
MGYTGSIVALTANAVAGQADIFLQNGFDDFISKPIDIRQMNLVLNRLIRDKQPQEVIDAARSKIKKKPEAPKPSYVDDKVIEAFVRDAVKTHGILKKIAESNDYSNEKNLRTYMINVHGIKSSLANIGKAELSAAAMKLEAASKDKTLDVIEAETPAFLESLTALIAELSPEENGAPEADTTEDNLGLLREKLVVIKAACENYDESTAEEALKELESLTWSKAVKDVLSEISEHLLHSDFEEAANAAEKAGR